MPSSSPPFLNKDATPTIVESPASPTAFASDPQDGADNDASERPRRSFHVAFSPDSDKEVVDASKLSDAFEITESPAQDDGAEVEIMRSSIELDVLPIELISLTDSFIDSLAAKKIYKTPPSIERLSELFQTFYAKASTNIATHIGASALATKRSRDPSPASSISSATSRFRNRPSAASRSSSSISVSDQLKVEQEQQMVTQDELADIKQSRKARDVTQHMLEEAVERRVCEGIYDRIYRHKSTQDEAQDAKLRSKTAALALVGIGPADLGIELEDGAGISPDATAANSDEINERLASARDDLVHMSESRYPAGKLNYLKAAHRSIVDTIAHFHPSASADEIMPMLIYTLITLPPENLHVISDINFIQHFRWDPKLTGEAAYCLTNLEAAISFLQTVDLATLRSDELPSGPPKIPRSTPSETFPPAYTQGSTPSEPETTKANAGPFKTPAWTAEPTAPTAPGDRRLGSLVPSPAQAFGAASDAVFNTADQGLKTVTNSLGDSYKFLLGRFRESQEGPLETIAVPRTLDDARKLISTPPPDKEGADTSAGGVGELKRMATQEDRGQGTGKPRDRSADSAASGWSANSKLKNLLGEDKSAPAPAPTPSTSQTPLRSLSHTFVPVARFGSQIDGMLRSFGRNSIAVPPTTRESSKPADGGDLATAFPDIAAALPPKKDIPKQEIPKIAPPNKRFMEMQNPGDLKINEVLDLLRDYRRLAGSLEKMGAFADKPS